MSPFTLSILHPERKKAGWSLTASHWDNVAGVAERDGDIKALQEAEAEAAGARRMVQIIDGTSEGPKACLARLCGARAA